MTTSDYFLQQGLLKRYTRGETGDRKTGCAPRTREELHRVTRRTIRQADREQYPLGPVENVLEQDEQGEEAQP